MPIAVKLFRGLVEVATIGCQSCLFTGDDSRTRGARETRDELYIDECKGKERYDHREQIV